MAYNALGDWLAAERIGVRRLRGVAADASDSESDTLARAANFASLASWRALVFDRRQLW